VWPEKLARYRDFFTDYAAKITADRPLNIRTLERYLLLANDLPGLRFSTTLKASKTEQAAATLWVEVTEKPVEWNARFTATPTKEGSIDSLPALWGQVLRSSMQLRPVAGSGWGG
jgi:hypothetical protein